uniref:MATH domain-containing protein n=2 Tax=Meloidogyne TaxID=189290 RepID=A0A915N272_MELJA
MEVDSVTDEVLSARTNGDKDPYKSEGQIILKIEKFSEFARESLGNRRLSDPVYIRGLPWRILAIVREMGRPAGCRCLGYFLQCNNGNQDPSWSCSAKATLKILAQKPEEENHVRQVTHVFHAKMDDWGYAQFMTFESIMNPEEGWYDQKEDAIILLVYVKADPPLGVKIDEERLKSLQGIKEKEKEIEINNSDGNLSKIKEELENLKKSKEKCEKQLTKKLKENKEIYERLAQNANQLAIINEENIKLKEENERLKNFNEYEEEIKVILLYVHIICI